LGCGFLPAFGKKDMSFYSVKNGILAAMLLSLIWFSGCNRLPAYSQPRIERGKALSLSSQTAITYRPITVDDFRATSLPDDLQDFARNLNAHTAVAIHTRPGALYVFAYREEEGHQEVCGHVANLTFEALMLPEKSWWSPALEKGKEAYVLQHEQIHFALMEIEARRLSEKAALEYERLQACAFDVEAAKAILSAILDQWMIEAEQETLLRHEEFDAATSRLYVPKVQQGWHNMVMQELQKSAAAE
jgi:hypothetical protein